MKERGVKLFPGNVAGAVEPDGWPEALNRGLRQQVEQLGFETGDEESVVDEVECRASVAGEGMGGHLHPAAGVAEARRQATLRGVRTEETWRQIEHAGQHPHLEAFLRLERRAEQRPRMPESREDLLGAKSAKSRYSGPLSAVGVWWRRLSMMSVFSIGVSPFWAFAEG